MKRLFAGAALLVGLTHAAFAGELTLFEHDGFRGHQLNLRNDATNLRDFDFNDRTSSVIVRSGRWQLCEHKDFAGYCAEFGPGEYPRLEGFNDKVSSAREIGGGGRWRDRDDYRGGDRDGGRWQNRDDYRDGYREGRRDEYRDDRGWRGGEAVQLFAGPRFEGPVIGLSDSIRTLVDVGFNDRAGSLIIREGRWEFCEHADFRGQCVVFGPGRYEWLGQLNNRISSMRRVR